MEPHSESLILSESLIVYSDVTWGTAVDFSGITSGLCKHKREENQAV